MIQHVWERAQTAKSLTSIIVATDHRDIFDCVQSFGGQAVMTPSDLPSGSDRVALVAKDKSADIIVNLQGDEPLLNSESIDQLVDSLIRNPKSQLSTLAVLRNDREEFLNSNCVKVVFDSQGRALYFSRSPLASQASGEFFKHIGIYAYRRESLFEFCRLEPSSLEVTEKLEQLRALQHGMTIQVCVVEQDTIAVDVPQDIHKVEDYLKKRVLSRGKMSTGEGS